MHVEMDEDSTRHGASGILPDMPGYREHPVHPRLAPFVRLVWSLELPGSGSPGPADRILPDGIVETVFHCGRPYRMRSGTDPFRPQARSLAVLQTARLVEITPPREASGFVSVRFQPWGFAHLTRVPLHRIAEAFPTAPDLWGPPAADLEERLAEADTTDARVRLVQGFLCGLLARHERPSTEPLVRSIWTADGDVRVRDLARELGMGERRLERVFREQIGMTPKRFARLSRFLKACRLLRSEPLPLTEIAHRAGYYDHAHFANDFRILAGESPSALRAREAVSYLTIP